MTTVTSASLVKVEYDKKSNKFKSARLDHLTAPIYGGDYTVNNKLLAYHKSAHPPTGREPACHRSGVLESSLHFVFPSPHRSICSGRPGSGALFHNTLGPTTALLH